MSVFVAVPSIPVDQKIPLCPEKVVRSVAATIAHDQNKFRSSLTFQKPIIGHTGNDFKTTR